MVRIAAINEVLSGILKIIYPERRIKTSCAKATMADTPDKNSNLTVMYKSINTTAIAQATTADWVSSLPMVGDTESTASLCSSFNSYFAL